MYSKDKGVLSKPPCGVSQNTMYRQIILIAAVF